MEAHRRIGELEVRLARGDAAITRVDAFIEKFAPMMDEMLHKRRFISRLKEQTWMTLVKWGIPFVLVCVIVFLTLNRVKAAGLWT